MQLICHDLKIIWRFIFENGAFAIEIFYTVIIIVLWSRLYDAILK